MSRKKRPIMFVSGETDGLLLDAVSDPCAPGGLDASVGIIGGPAPPANKAISRKDQHYYQSFSFCHLYAFAPVYFHHLRMMNRKRARDTGGPREKQGLEKSCGF